MLKTVPYVGPEKISENVYYIHNHVQNIGKAAGGDRESDSDLARIYASKKDAAFSAAKKQYMNLFKSSIKNGETVFALLNTAMSDQDIVTLLSNEIGEQLPKILNIDKMQTLMQKQMAANSLDWKNMFNANKKTVVVEEFNKVLQSLADAYQLIGDPQQGARLGQYLLNSVNTENKTISYSRLGKNLAAQLKKIEREVQGMGLSSFEKQQIDHIQGSLLPIANRFQKGYVKTKKGISYDLSDAIHKIVLNVFSEGFAEAVAGDIKNIAYNNIIESIENVRLTGRDKTDLALTDISGDFKKYSGKDPQSGKADLIFENIGFKINVDKKKDMETIYLDVGLSNKFYVNAHFPNVNTATKDNLFSISYAGGNLPDALTMIFGQDNRNMYLSYNTITFGADLLPEATINLQDVLLTRMITNIAAARGRGGQSTGGNSNDFAQYLFLNGRIVPVWDIILSTQQFVGKSVSQLKNTQSSQSVLLSLEQRNTLVKKGKVPLSQFAWNTYARSVELNRLIAKVKIRAEVNLNNLNKNSIFSKYNT